MPHTRHDWEREALAYLARRGVRDLRHQPGAYTTDIPGHRQGVLYQLEQRGLVMSRGYGTQGTRWTITEEGLLSFFGGAMPVLLTDGSANPS